MSWGFCFGQWRIWWDGVWSFVAVSWRNRRRSMEYEEREFWHLRSLSAMQFDHRLIPMKILLLHHKVFLFHSLTSLLMQVTLLCAGEAWGGGHDRLGGGKEFRGNINISINTGHRPTQPWDRDLFLPSHCNISTLSKPSEKSLQDASRPSLLISCLSYSPTPRLAGHCARTL